MVNAAQKLKDRLRAGDALKRVDITINDEPEFFAPGTFKAIPQVWYAIVDGEWQFYDLPGPHPTLGTPLVPMNEQAAEQWMSLARKKRMEIKTEREREEAVLRQREEEERERANQRAEKEKRRARLAHLQAEERKRRITEERIKRLKLEEEERERLRVEDEKYFFSMERPLRDRLRMIAEKYMDSSPDCTIDKLTLQEFEINDLKGYRNLQGAEIRAVLTIYFRENNMRIERVLHESTVAESSEIAHKEVERRFLAEVSGNLKAVMSDCVERESK